MYVNTYACIATYIRTTANQFYHLPDKQSNCYNLNHMVFQSTLIKFLLILCYSHQLEWLMNLLFQDSDKYLVNETNTFQKHKNLVYQKILGQIQKCLSNSKYWEAPASFAPASYYVSQHLVMYLKYCINVYISLTCTIYFQKLSITL